MSSAERPRVAPVRHLSGRPVRPAVGFAAVKLLEEAGCRVEVPRARPAAASRPTTQGDRTDDASRSRTRYRGVRRLRLRRGAVGLLRRNAEEALSGAVRGRPADAERARRLAARTFELTAFLVDVLGVRCRGRAAGARRPITIPARACASSASGASRAGCSRASGPELAELPGGGVCCGFGGTFCVKYPEISTKMVDDKAACDREHRRRAGARGRPRLPDEHRRPPQAARLPVEARHVAEVLAGASTAADRRRLVRLGAPCSRPRSLLRTTHAARWATAAAGGARLRPHGLPDRRRAGGRPAARIRGAARRRATRSRTIRWRTSTSISRLSSGG